MTELLGEYQGLLVEGIKYDPRNQSVLWIDIKRGEIHRVLVSDGSLQWSTHEEIKHHDPAESVGFIGLTTDVDTVVACCKYGVAYANFATGNLDYQFRFHKDHKRLRSNDGLIDPDGNLWIGTMTDFPYEDDMQPEGTLYRITPRFKECKAMVTGFKIPNGLAINDHEVYFTESKAQTIWRYAYDGTDLGERTAFIDVSGRYSGEPDGFAYDDSGIYVALFGDGKVAHYNWRGEHVGEYTVGGKRVTCVGGQGYVTTAHASLQNQVEPSDHGGRLYQIPVKIDQQLHKWSL
ncbi:cell growth-regulated gene 1 protein [Diutina catenulata]